MGSVPAKSHLPFPFVAVPDATPDPKTTALLDDSQRRERYRTVREKALEDPKILALQAKADSAPTEEDHRKLSRAYYKALFEKMRKLDPSLKEHIGRMESVTLKRIDEN